MKSIFNILGVLYFCALSSSAVSHEFRDPEHPGHRESIEGNNLEKVDFLSCVMNEYLKIEYVEACAIFKREGEVYLECRYLPDTYEKISTERISEDGEIVGNACAEKILGSNESIFSKFLSGIGF